MEEELGKERTFGAVGRLVLAEPRKVLILKPGHIWGGRKSARGRNTEVVTRGDVAYSDCNTRYTCCVTTP